MAASIKCCGRVRGLLLEFLAVFAEEMAEQQRNFRGPLAQRRHVDREHVQSIVQILAQAARFHRLLNFHVGCRQDAHVHVDQLAAAQARILMVLQDVQELGLQVGAHFRDFVQEDRALGGQLKLPRLGTHGAGKRALLVAEQFGFEQFAGKRGAIHFDERLIAARRTHMNHARDDFLSHAALAVNEYRHIDRSNLQDLLADAHHLRAGGQEATGLP